jgi:hypothetical protein
MWTVIPHKAAKDVESAAIGAHLRPYVEMRRNALDDL